MAGRSQCASIPAWPESRLRGKCLQPQHPGVHLHLWLSPPSTKRCWFGIHSLSPMQPPLCRADSHGQGLPQRAPAHGLDSLPWAPVAKSRAELISLQLIACTSVSGVLLQRGMPLTKFQLQSLALLQAHPQVRGLV